MMIFPDLVIKQISTRLISSGIAALVILVIAILGYFILRRKCTSVRQRQKIKHRFVYIAILIFLLVMIRVWIEGFTHLFTMLSLIAAGIVITNKENIMNITGWLIINWRGVFSAGDYIQIQSVTGYVDAVKLLNFKVLETTGLGENRATGKTIKIPNGLIVTNPIIVFPNENTVLLQHIDHHAMLNKNIQRIVQNLEKVLIHTLAQLYQNDRNYSLKIIKRNNKCLANLIDLQPVIEIKLIPEKNDQVLIRATFYCYPRDLQQVEKALVMALVKSKSMHTKKPDVRNSNKPLK